MPTFGETTRGSPAERRPMAERCTLADLEDRPQAVVFDGEPRTVRLALDAGESVPEHHHPGRTILFHQLSGEVTVSLDGDVHRLAPGQVLRFDGERRIEPRARTDSESLIVLAPAGGQP